MQRFYFDHNATTPVAPEVIEAMTEVMRADFGNASSVHSYGQIARKHLENARAQVAHALRAEPQEIIFVSGGTEADNLAVFGMVRYATGERKHVITTAIEHPAVLQACAQLESEGVEVTRLPVDRHGLVHPGDVKRALQPETVLISVMHVNNELGTLQPVEEISRVAREAGVCFHSDGVQAFGKVPIDVNVLGVDLYSISGHKVYAPKGIGALYCRRETRLGPIQFGGRHERGRRAGTENIPGAVAFGRAAALIGSTPEQVSMADLRNRLEAGILGRVSGAQVNGACAPRTPNTSNISFNGVDGEALLIALDLAGFAVSSGAACASGATEPSHVLNAIGLTRSQARGTLRFSLGRSNTAEQVDRLVEAVTANVARLRSALKANLHA